VRADSAGSNGGQLDPTPLSEPELSEPEQLSEPEPNPGESRFSWANWSRADPVSATGRDGCEMRGWQRRCAALMDRERDRRVLD